MNCRENPFLLLACPNTALSRSDLMRELKCQYCNCKKGWSDTLTAHNDSEISTVVTYTEIVQTNVNQNDVRFMKIFEYAQL